MMDWNQIRQQWQANATSLPTVESVAALQRRDDAIRTRLRRRDWLESAAGLLIAPVFLFVASIYVSESAWPQAFFAGFLAAWALYVPWHLWRNRRQLPQLMPDLPLLNYLQASHAAMVLQARQLEHIWYWYLAPCAFGVIGLNLSARGPTLRAFVYAAVVLGFCVFLAKLNKHAARTQIRVHADAIAEQISQLTKEPSA